jgi:hypothetical protein
MNPTYITFLASNLVYVVIVLLAIINLSSNWGSLSKGGGVKGYDKVVARHLIYVGIGVVNSLVWSISGIMSLIIFLK